MPSCPGIWILTTHILDHSLKNPIWYWNTHVVICRQDRDRCITQMQKVLRFLLYICQALCLLRNLYAGQKATVRTGHGTTDWFQIGKGVQQGCILSSCLFNLYAEYIMRNAGLEEAQAGIKIARRNNNNLRYAGYGINHHYGRKWRGTKKPLDESERGEWKSWLKIQHSKK